MPEAPETYSDDTYEILPEKELEELKDELKKLKKAELHPTKELQVNVVELNAKLDKMLEVFEEAMKGITSEQEKSMMERVQALEDKLEEISEQNKTIAEGMVAIADMLKGKPAESELPPLPRPQMPRASGPLPPPPKRPPLPPLPR